MSPNQSLVMPCSLDDPEEVGPQQGPISTPREFMRRNNCQEYRFHRTETYPSIRTKVSRCDPSNAQAFAWMSDSLEADGCGRPFDTKDDVLLLWQASPHKDTLGFYGVGSPSLQPESVMFNQTLMASLKKVGVDGTRRRFKRPTPPTPPKETPTSIKSVYNQMCQPLILNRQALQTELRQMPIVQQRLHPGTAFETVFCTHVVDPYDPLGVAQHEEMMVSRSQVVGIERPPEKTPHGLRRRHWYCPSDCGGEQNACTQYEWAKYKLDPRPYNKEFKQRIRDEKTIKRPEPKDYDQLYERFLKCFEQEPSPDPLCKIYEICCPTKDSRGDDGQGGGDGHGGASGRPGGEGDDDETEGGNDGTGDKDKDKNKGKNKDKDDDGDKVKFDDKDKDKKKKVKDDSTDKNKSKDKDKRKETGDKGKAVKDKYGKGGESKRGSGDSEKDKKRKRKGSDSDTDNERATKIPEWHSEEPTKNPSLSEGKDQDPGKKPNNNQNNQLVPDEEGEGTGYDSGYKLTDPDKPTKTTSGTGKKKSTKKNKGKANAKNKDKNKAKVSKTCPICPPVGCPCEICDIMNRCRGEQDPIFILEMKRAEKKRQALDYIRQMCHRQYIRDRCQQSPQKPHFEKHRDCLGAVQDLEKLLAGCQDKVFSQKLLHLVANLRSRIYQRMSDCINPHLNCSESQNGF